MSHRDFTNILGVAARLDQDAMGRSSAGLPPDYYARDPVPCTNPDCRKLTYGSSLAGYLWRDCCQTCIDNLYDEFKVRGNPDERQEDLANVNLCRLCHSPTTGSVCGECGWDSSDPAEQPHWPGCGCADCDCERHHAKVDDDEVRKHQRG